MIIDMIDTCKIVSLDYIKYIRISYDESISTFQAIAFS